MIDSYDKLSIKKYRELIALEKPEDDDIQYGIEILSILSGVEPDELLDLPLDEFSSMMAKTKFLYDKIEPVDYKEVGKKIKVGDIECKVVQSAKELTAGQYIDYKTYVSKEDFIAMLPYIMTVFLIPEKNKYNNGYDVVELAKEIDEKMDIKTALSLSGFFLHQSKMSIQSSLTYLKWKMKRMMRKEKNQEIKKQIAEAVEQMEYLKSLLRISDGSIQQ